jgi:hypothetical protein
MRTLLPVACLTVWILVSCLPDTRKVGWNAISTNRIRQHIDFLASDSLEGRNTPSRGLTIASHFIAQEFARNGFLPVNGSHFYNVPLAIVSLGDTNSLLLKTEKGSKTFRIKSEYMPFDMTANSSVKGSIVFAGYGISAPDYQYDDYASIDVKGKVVFVLRHEPGENDTASVFDGDRPTDYSNVADKVRIAAEHGAAAVLVATDPLNHASIAPRGFPWPSLSRFLPDDALPITLRSDESRKIAVVHVGKEFITELFGSVDSLKRLQALIDSHFKPNSFEIQGAEAVVRTSTSVQDMSADNVVGFLEGSDPELRKEVVVIGAHYDHVGTMKTAPEGEDRIFNGADDNASGTTALLAISSAFGASSVKPKRSVLLMAFAAEEKGLLGSRAYVENPLYPLDRTVAMLNLDMVGRNSIDSIIVIGMSRNPELAAFAKEENEEVGFVIQDHNLTSGSSDHASFSKKNIPFLFFFSGFHPQYHQVTDHSDLIDAGKIARVARLIFRTAWRIANDYRQYELKH